MTRVLERLKARFPEAGHLDSDAQMQALVDRVPRAEFRKMMKEEEDRAAQQARWYPASDEVTADHNMKRIQYALLHAQESMEGMRVDTGWAAPRNAGGGTTVHHHFGDRGVEVQREVGFAHREVVERLGVVPQNRVGVDVRLIGKGHLREARRSRRVAVEHGGGGTLIGRQCSSRVRRCRCSNLSTSNRPRARINGDWSFNERSATRTHSHAH